MNLVDSSGWLEFFAGGRNASRFATPLAETSSLLVPSICIYEVCKVVLRERDERHMLQVLGQMQKAQTVDLTPSIALSASKISLSRSLPMADSIILATARTFDATVWTQDVDFKDIPGVRYFPKKRPTE